MQEKKEPLLLRGKGRGGKRKGYASPRLTRYGKMRDLTTETSGEIDDGGGGLTLNK